ncbi:MAG: hypothetical protein EBU11_05705 [Gammaproteobacteria bacterium]|nr:hypothetical protein [Gammaproteobacteria bacterium]
MDGRCQGLLHFRSQRMTGNLTDLTDNIFITVHLPACRASGLQTGVSAIRTLLDGISYCTNGSQ